MEGHRCRSHADRPVVPLNAAAPGLVVNMDVTCLRCEAHMHARRRSREARCAIMGKKTFCRACVVQTHLLVQRQHRVGLQPCAYMASVRYVSDNKRATASL